MQWYHDRHSRYGCGMGQKTGMKEKWYGWWGLSKLQKIWKSWVYTESMLKAKAIKPKSKQSFTSVSNHGQVKSLEMGMELKSLHFSTNKVQQVPKGKAAQSTHHSHGTNVPIQHVVLLQGVATIKPPTRIRITQKKMFIHNDTNKMESKWRNCWKGVFFETQWGSLLEVATQGWLPVWKAEPWRGLKNPQGMGNLSAQVSPEFGLVKIHLRVNGHGWGHATGQAEVNFQTVLWENVSVTGKGLSYACQLLNLKVESSICLPKGIWNPSTSSLKLMNGTSSSA